MNGFILSNILRYTNAYLKLNWVIKLVNIIYKMKYGNITENPENLIYTINFFWGFLETLNIIEWYFRPQGLEGIYLIYVQ